MCARALGCKSKMAGQFKWVFIPTIKVTARFFVPIKAGGIPAVRLPSHHPTWGAQNRQNLMKTRARYRSAKDVSWVNEKPWRQQMKRLDKPVRYPEDIKTLLPVSRSRTVGFWGTIVGPKDLGTPAHLLSSPRPRPRREKCPRMNKDGPKPLGGIAEDRPVLNESGSWKEKVAHFPKQPSQSSQTKGPTLGDSYEGMMEEQL